MNRTQKDGTRLTVPCPRNVALYNEYMGGVDHGDHLRGSYRIRLKCMKNYKYVFGFLFDVAITNAYILYSRFDVRSDKPMDHKTFRMVLAEQLIGGYKSKKRAGRPRKRSSPLKHMHLTSQHIHPVNAACTANSTVHHHAGKNLSGIVVIVMVTLLSA